MQIAIKLKHNPIADAGQPLLALFIADVSAPEAPAAAIETSTSRTTAFLHQYLTNLNGSMQQRFKGELALWLLQRGWLQREALATTDTLVPAQYASLLASPGPAFQKCLQAATRIVGNQASPSCQIASNYTVQILRAARLPKKKSANTETDVNSDPAALFADDPSIQYEPNVGWWHVPGPYSGVTFPNCCVEIEAMIFFQQMCLA